MTVPGEGGGTDHSSLARSDATLRELLPALVQTDGENPQGLNGDLALQSAGHALRAGVTACDGQSLDKGETRQAPHPVGSGSLLHSNRETQSALAAIVSPEVRATPTGEGLKWFPGQAARPVAAG